MNIEVKILRNEHGRPAGKLADAEIHFIAGELTGLKLVGFTIWERRDGNGRRVTFPGRPLIVHGDRRNFELLRAIGNPSMSSKQSPGTCRGECWSTTLISGSRPKDRCLRAWSSGERRRRLKAQSFGLRAAGTGRLAISRPASSQRLRLVRPWPRQTLGRAGALHPSSAGSRRSGRIRA